MTRHNRGLGDPLPPDIVAAIDDIEPCEHPVDFWDRLEAAVDADQAEPFDAVPSLGLRVVTVAAAVATIAVLAVAVFIRTNAPVERLDVAEQSEQSLPASADLSDDGSPAPTTTLPAAASDPKDTALQPTPPSAVTPPTTDGSEASDTPPWATPQSETPPSETLPADARSTTSSLPSGSSKSTPEDSPQEPATTDAPPTPASPPPLQRIEAERMAMRTSGGFDPDAYRLYENGYVQDDINVGVDGTYRFTVRAWGESDTTFRPELEVLVDGETVGTTRVDLDNYRRYTFEAAVVDGLHQLRLAFTNDPRRPDNDVDLIIDWVEVEWIGP